MFTLILAPDPGYSLLMTLFNITTTRASLCAQASDVSLVEEARAYENNCIFAEGAPSPRLGRRVDPRPPHRAPGRFIAEETDGPTAEPTPGPTAQPTIPPQGRFDRQSFGRHRRHLGHELAAALYTYPFPHAFPARVGP